MSYLEITLKVPAGSRPAAVAVYAKYRERFLATIHGAIDKQLLVRDDDVQVLHTFVDNASAEAYLTHEMFNNDVVRELGPLLGGPPEIRIYATV